MNILEDLRSRHTSWSLVSREPRDRETPDRLKVWDRGSSLHPRRVHCRLSRPLYRDPMIKDVLPTNALGREFVIEGERVSYCETLQDVPLPCHIQASFKGNLAVSEEPPHGL